MRALGYTLPPSYVFEGDRCRRPRSGWRFCLRVYLLLACAFFVYVQRGAVRTGLLARYRAENVV